jgi:hypothetical protein
VFGEQTENVARKNLRPKLPCKNLDLCSLSTGTTILSANVTFAPQLGVMAGVQRGRADGASRDRFCAVFLHGSVRHWGRNRSCKPAYLAQLAPGFGCSSALKGAVLAHKLTLARFCVGRARCLSRALSFESCVNPGPFPRKVAGVFPVGERLLKPHA